MIWTIISELRVIAKSKTVASSWTATEHLESYGNSALTFYKKAIGKPEYITQTLNDTKYKAVKVADKIYIPDKSKLL